MLDIGGGGNPEPGFVNMDKRKLNDQVDIVHDAEVFPYPLEDNSCAVVMMSHLLEHIKPWLSLDLFDEIWRILTPNGVLMVVSPYATSFGMMQDPTHCNFVNEATFAYFDPSHESGLYTIYRPKPWKVTKIAWSMDGNIECAMRKVDEDNKKQQKGKS